MSTNECPEVKIIPLGGLDKIGMNITVVEYEDTIVVIDCGSSFPDEEMYGIIGSKSSSKEGIIEAKKN